MLRDRACADIQREAAHKITLIDLVHEQNIDRSAAGLDRFRKSENRPVGRIHLQIWIGFGLSCIGVDCPTCLGVAIDGTGHREFRLRMVSPSLREGLADRTAEELEFREDEISIAGRPRTALWQGVVGQRAQSYSGDRLSDFGRLGVDEFDFQHRVPSESIGDQDRAVIEELQGEEFGAIGAHGMQQRDLFPLQLGYLCFGKFLLLSLQGSEFLSKFL